MLKAWGHAQKKDDSTEQVKICLYEVFRLPGDVCVLTWTLTAQHIILLYALKLLGLQYRPQSLLACLLTSREGI